MKDGTKFKPSLFYRAIYRYKIENYGWELFHFRLKIIMAIKFTIIIEMKYGNKVKQEYWVEETNKQIHVLH